MSESPRRLIEGRGATSEDQAIGQLLRRLPAGAPDARVTEQRWHDRVWRELEGGSVRRRSAPWLILVPTAALVAALLVFAHTNRPVPEPGAEVATLDRVAGAVLATDSSAGWSVAKSGTSLSTRSRLKTASDGQAVVEVPRLASVLVKPSSELAMEAVGAQTRIRLSVGELLAHVSKRPPGSTFVVQTPRYSVTVVGTLFSVRVRSGGATDVSVSEGVVQVGGEGGSWRVAAGQSWSSEGREKRGEDSIVAEDREVVRGIAGLTRNAVAAFRPDIDVPSRPDRREVARGSMPSTAERGSAARGVPEHVVPAPREHETTTALALPERRSVPAPVPASEPPLAAPPLVLATLGSAVPPGAALAPRAELTPPPVVLGAPPPEDPYEEAQRLAAAGRYRQAEAALERTVALGAAHGDLALYEMGRLRQRKLGDLPGALESFARYRDEHPRGALAQEVALSIIETQLARSDKAAAFAEMSRFLAEHPESERVPEVRLLVGNVLRERGQCGQAVDEYRQVERGPAAGDALYFSAWCQRRLGQVPAAEATLRDYLRRFPTGEHHREASDALEAK